MKKITIASAIFMCAGATMPLHAQTKLTAVQELRIGALDGENALTRPGPLAVLDDGGIIVAQPQERLARHFDADGKLVRVFGQPGDGPGEFRNVTDLGVSGDSIWISDGSARRMTYFSLNGEVMAELSWPGENRSPARPAGQGYTSVEYSRNGSLDRDLGQPWPIIRYTRQATVVDTVAVVHTYAKPISVEGRLVQNPLRDGSMSGFSPSGDRLVIVDRRIPTSGSRGQFTITWVETETGDTLKRATFAYTAKAIPDEYLQQLVSRAATGPMRSHVGALADALRTQRYLPPISAMEVTGDDTVWVARETAGVEEVRWYRFNLKSADTQYLMLPVDSRVLAENGDRIWVLEHDEFDVPYLTRYRSR